MDSISYVVWYIDIHRHIVRSSVLRAVAHRSKFKKIEKTTKVSANRCNISLFYDIMAIWPRPRIRWKEKKTWIFIFKCLAADVRCWIQYSSMTADSIQIHHRKMQNMNLIWIINWWLNRWRRLVRSDDTVWANAFCHNDEYMQFRARNQSWVNICESVGEEKHHRNIDVSLSP